MKTFIIPVNRPPRDFCEYLETLGIYKLKRNKSNTPVGAPIYIEGISAEPDVFKTPFKTIWVHNKYWAITDHRVNLSDKGEQILKDNAVKYTIE